MLSAKQTHSDETDILKMVHGQQSTQPAGYRKCHDIHDRTKDRVLIEMNRIDKYGESSVMACF